MVNFEQITKVANHIEAIRSMQHYNVFWLCSSCPAIQFDYLLPSWENLIRHFEYFVFHTSVGGEGNKDTMSKRCDRKSRRELTPWQVRTILNDALKTLDCDDLSLLIVCKYETKLPLKHLLGWFDYDVSRRLQYLKTAKKTELLGEWARAARLFEKAHQTYLRKLKWRCAALTGVCGVTFEMLERSIKKLREFERQTDEEQIKD